ncbi:hypothetical protein AB0M36_34920 [Actinoplanes sp. NPDC051346]|uniref:hypothetical protein n=1 Tax=Actinoplanes sp. NPDC051346 TaxID=3155048 RepID=UPI00342157FF
MLVDLGRRAALTNAQRSAAENESDRATQVLVASAAGQSCPPSDDDCLAAPVPPTADTVRRALVDEGFHESVARTARVDDPTPAGSVLAALSVGPVCVLLVYDRNGQHGYIAGRLPGGGCLAP